MDAMKRLQMEQALKQSKEMEPMYIELCAEVSKQLRHYYDALLEKNFAPYEALQIIIAHGVTPGQPGGGK